MAHLLIRNSQTCTIHHITFPLPKLRMKSSQIPNVRPCTLQRIHQTWECNYISMAQP